VPVVILTARTEEADKVRGFRLGADDYVTKPFGVMELIARIEAVMRRSSPGLHPQRAVHFGDVAVDVATRTVHKSDIPILLTPMEFNLLLALAKRKGAVVSRLDLLKEVWGTRRRCSPGPSIHTWPSCGASWKTTRRDRSTSSRHARRATVCGRGEQG